MSDQPDMPRAIDPALVALCDAYCDDRLTVESAAELDRHVTTSAEAAAYFVRHVHLQAVIERSAANLQTPAASRGGPAARSRHARSIARFGALAAAVALVAFSLWLALSDSTTSSTTSTESSQGSAVALLTHTDHAVFADDAGAMKLGADLPAGPIRLISGKAQVMFESTAVVDLVGPCEFRVVDGNSGYLTRGTLTAFVPQSAHGFAVTTPTGLKISDLGTEFSVHVEQDTVDVHVFQGRIVTSYTDPFTGQLQQRQLEAFESKHYVMGSRVSIRDLEMAENRFLNQHVLAAGDAGIGGEGRPEKVLDFGRFALLPFDDQDGGNNQPTALELTDEGRTLILRGNAWKHIKADYTVTRRTVIEFDFRSSVEGEQHGLGIDSDGTYRNGWTRFQLFGTMPLQSGGRDFDDYEASEFKHYRIPLGRYYTGPMHQLIFFADDDARGRAESVFRDVRLYEAASASPTHDPKLHRQGDAP